MKRTGFSRRSLSLLLALLLSLSAFSAFLAGCTEEQAEELAQGAADAFVEGIIGALDTAEHDTPLLPTDTDVPGETASLPEAPEAEEPDSGEAYPSVERVDKTMYLLDTVRLRKSADKNADYDGKLERGTAVTVLTCDTETHWCSFLYDGKTYYVNRQSLSDKQPEGGTPSPTEPETEPAPPAGTEDDGQPDEHTYYYEKDDVALYLHVYGHLPDNFITKKEAEALGWDSSKGNLWKVADGFCIGGDRFGNYEGILPKNNGTYYECDVGYAGGFRGADRLIYDNKGDIWYTGDHYASFTKLY